ncbi:hypothetical protein [Pseudomonas pohangensis]|nr:hypothetical protein [Pseudomonas pohangensis]
MKSRSYLLCVVALFVCAFVAVPLRQLHGLALMPGDIADARLNNYFLENIYQFFFGESESLWQLGFFSPFPYVLGFSDNLFGSAPVYLLARLFVAEPDTAFQLWFLFGYVANFAAAYYALRLLGGSPLASSVGALIFAFALPTTAHAGHAQLHYRFGVPLAMAFFTLFLEQKKYRLLVISGAWLVWQFYAGIYMGFFTLLLLAATVCMHFVFSRCSLKQPFVQPIRELNAQWQIQVRQDKWRILLYLTGQLIALVVLFYPYIQVSRLYGAVRSWGEIASMLPRPQSYFLADLSDFWSWPTAGLFADIPMRHEHQMFMGAMPMLLAAMGFLVGARSSNAHTFMVIAGVLFGLIALTLNVGGFSFWYVLHQLPLASAIRVMTRLDQVLLFPVAYMVVLAIDYLRDKWRWGGRLVMLVILPLVFLECAATSMYVSHKSEWRDRLSLIEATVPQEVNPDAILFFAQRQGPYFADELDAMWVSLRHGAKTLNGYSGFVPPGYTLEYGKDCAELPRRLALFMSFVEKSDDENAYLDFMSKVVPIGFEGCDPAWVTQIPGSFSLLGRRYTQEEIRKLDYRFGSIARVEGQTIVYLSIHNTGDLTIAAGSRVNTPMRISWRFLDSTGLPASGWDTRMDLPFDIPAKGELAVRLPIDSAMEIKGGSLQVSLVQEGVFWAHDIGVQPLTIPWQ